MSEQQWDWGEGADGGMLVRNGVWIGRSDIPETINQQEATIAQQQARIANLEQGMDTTTLIASNAVEALAAERERADVVENQRQYWEAMAVAKADELQAEREKAAPEADHVGGLMNIPAYKATGGRTVSDQYTVVLSGNIEPHFNTRLERDAFIEWKDGLQQRLHDAEAELHEYRELGAETGRELVEQRDAAQAERDNWKMLHGRLLLANREVAASEHAAHARITALEEALRELLDAYCQAMSDQYDFPDNPWTMERGHRSNGAVPDTTALAARALLSPAPADAAGGPEA